LLAQGDRPDQVFSSVADPGCLSRIPDTNFFHPVSRIQGQKDYWIPDPDPHPRQRIKVPTFDAKNCFYALGYMIRDVYLGSGSQIRILIFYPSRIPGSKRHQIPGPNPDPQNCFFRHKKICKLQLLGHGGLSSG
jgi:hypothetical protein